MTQEYYISSASGPAGPYDIVALVRKIRNGSINVQTQLQQIPTDTPKPAGEWPELKEFFDEMGEERNTAPENITPATHYSFGKAMVSGWSFLQRNQYSTVFSGLFVLAIILAAAIVNFMLPQMLHAIAYMAFFVGAYFMLSCYMFSVLRMVRGQPVDPVYLQSKIAPAIKSLLLSSLFICIPAVFGLALMTSDLPAIALLIGLSLFAIPGLFVMALYAFSPLLILDKGYDFWEGMEASRKAVLKSGVESTGVIYALFVINFLAGLCFLLPLAITLPITMGALAEIYDETFG